MWMLISLQEIITIAINFYLNPKLYHVHDDNKYYKIEEAAMSLSTIDDFLNAVTHWLFAVEYLRLALKFPLLMGMLSEE